VIYKQYFTVRGTGEFPYDMLRYDQCWPCREVDSPLLNSNEMLQAENYFKTPRDVRIERRVESASVKPTVARWRSFGWGVLEESIATFKR
jgi:hypothetical protein